MVKAETTDFVSMTDPGEPEYHVRVRAKYAIVLSGERDEVVGGLRRRECD
jgi:hypothetical protein